MPKPRVTARLERKGALGLVTRIRTLHANRGHSAMTVTEDFISIEEGQGSLMQQHLPTPVHLGLNSRQQSVVS